MPDEAPADQQCRPEARKSATGRPTDTGPGAPTSRRHHRKGRADNHLAPKGCRCFYLALRALPFATTSPLHDPDASCSHDGAPELAIAPPSLAAPAIAAPAIRAKKRPGPDTDRCREPGLRKCRSSGQRHCRNARNAAHLLGRFRRTPTCRGAPSPSTSIVAANQPPSTCPRIATKSHSSPSSTSPS